MGTAQKLKPLLRGHFHQAAFFIALGACAVLLAQTSGFKNILAASIYSFSLVCLFGTSALYHRPQWNEKARLRMKKLDHSAIFILIAGTFTPICMISLPTNKGKELLLIIWIFAAFGILQSIFWVKAPKWLSVILYVTMGWLAMPYLSEMNLSLVSNGTFLIFLGGIIYTVGALVYGFKKPNPWPSVFGYHEIFHLMVFVAALCHFALIYQLVS